MRGLWSKNERTGYIDWVILTVTRWAVLLRHPHVAHWYRIRDKRPGPPNPALPRTYNDKYFWRKIFDHNPEFTEVSDKLAVRDWLRRNGHDMQSPKVLWQGTRPEDIPDDAIRPGTVLKANHGSGTNLFIRKAPPARAKLIEIGQDYLSRDHGREMYEPAYFSIERKLFVEELIPGGLIEFKMYTFHDRVERIAIIYDRFGQMAADIWLPDDEGGWMRSEGKSAVSDAAANQPLPDSFPEALAFARDVGRHFDHMRVDVLSDGTRNWFNELTVYNQGGVMRGLGWRPGARLNTAWDLRDSWFMKTPQRGVLGIYQRALRRVLDG